MKFASREDLLGLIRYRDIECPDAGAVSVFDYISAGAIAEFARHRASAEAALSAVIRSSLDDSDAVFPKLTSNDYVAVAQHLVSAAGVKERFDAELQNSAPADAFVQAIEESSLWKSHLESEIKLRRALAQSIRPFNSLVREIERQQSLVREASTRANVLKQFERRAIPTRQTAIVELESFRSCALRASQVFSEVGRVHQDSLVSLHRWNGLADQFASTTKLVSGAITRQNDLTRMVDRLNRIKSLVAPIADLSCSFADVAAGLRSARSISNELLTKANRSLVESRSLTLKTSDFFADIERPFRLARIEPVLPLQVVEQEQEIQSACDEGENILHEETALVVAEGTSLAEGIRRAVADELDQRLRRFDALFTRLDKLSKPTVFLDFMEEFAIVAARDYWMTLWTDPGNTWQSRPERHAQAMLGMFLHGKWSDVAFVGREIASGDGFVDLLVSFMARDYIVELKVIGAGWPVSHAESGLTQLEQYMANYQSQEAYLVVFDGRKTSRGRQLPEKHETKHGIIHVVVVPAYFDAPSSH